MKERKDLPPQLVIGIIAVVVLIVGYVLYSRTVVPEPTIPPDQTIQNPLGNNAPRRAGGPGANGGIPATPAPGTSGPQGFGPSRGAPIPR
ncbi:MAG TPA: hypothetical protein VFB21_22315 [Chthonomonadaceae bacterium]|nr:hypothetical protein [Chthonomonadaceae bacterium]